MGEDGDFDGAKMALFLGDKLAVILRDDLPDLLFAGFWDLPGGGREGAETPLACAQRECREELGLDVPETAIVWEQAFADRGGTKWFFVAKLPEAAVDAVVFGDEGQRWALMTPAAFIDHPKAVPAFQARLRAYIEEIGM